MGARSATSRSSSKSIRSTSARGSGQALGLGGYLQESQRPIVILAFLIPLVVLYEAGARLYHEDVVAFALLKVFAGWVNVYGRGVPAALLGLSLLVWHLARGDRWQFRLATLGGMLIESILLALPLLIIAVLCNRYQAYLPMIALSRNSLGALWSLSLGAGVYEELVFRFYGCGGLRLFIEGLLGVKRPVSTILIVVVSSVLFSLYHYLGTEHFSAFSFLFRTIAGAYFAIVFLYRGLGLSAGAHAVYDIIVVTLQHL